MYKDYFGFYEVPFSIVPSARYLFLSQRHREAMHHLQAGLGQGGGFAMLTGEVGTGKTTVAKAMLASLDDKTASGFILNPTFSSQDLLEAICDEFSLNYHEKASLKQLSQAIYHYLIDNDQQGINTLLVIDEAQHLSAEVLEQLRLLTNLETDDHKLLKVLLIGQPELQEKLRTTQLRQLAQRITGRYHLLPLTEGETRQYIEFRLSTAGGNMSLFSKGAVSVINQASQGIPRLINLIGDKALQYAYHSGEKSVSKLQAQKACEDILSFQAPGVGLQRQNNSHGLFEFISTYAMPALLGIAVAGGLYWKGADGLAWLSSLSNQQFAEPVSASTTSPVSASTTSPKAVISPDDNVAEPYPEDLVRSLFNREDKISAIQELYAVWGYKADLLDGLCEESSNSSFECQKYLGTFAQIEKQNLPVVMTLYLDRQQSYVVLYQVSGDQVQVLNGQQRISMPKSWLEQLWTGEYYSIWQRELQITLRLNQQGEQVRLLDEKLSKVLGSTPSGNDVFDQALKHKVEIFQRWQNIHVDGIAGQITLRKLELLTQSNPPFIRVERSQEESL
ncbi:Putative general secretion pathway protein A [Vibrio thalassae]|uniref:General secretion pathway protein A n=1 Tax=Vibrio thalassae TaxID=1243014 RepID=A0A240E9A4_9VIBR|nr:AAA family ATPase [Vibrio thalassae]SNX45294.1 Putative general secretion pathway protein A [Vibrio thalassae]